MNADTIIRLNRFPSKGETVTAIDGEGGGVRTIAGGKGANQAVAVARLGLTDSTTAHFVGQFGSDAHASMLRSTLLSHDVDISYCRDCVDCPSGLGLVFLQPDGAVASVVVGGSNAAWPVADGADEETREWWAGVQDLVRGAAALLLQREVPEHVNERLAEVARAAGVPVVQDVGGEDRPISDAQLARVDFVSPNLSELQRLVGTTRALGDDESVVAAARELQARGARNVLVTLGDRGSLLIPQPAASPSSDASDRQPTVLRQGCCPIPGEGSMVDETGAGDCFRAAFTVALVEGKPLPECLRFAAAAGAVAVSREGAVPAIPSRQDLEDLLPLLQEAGEGDGTAAAAAARNLRGGAAAATATSSADDLGTHDDQEEEEEEEEEAAAAEEVAVVSEEEEDDSEPLPEDCPWQFASRINSMKDGAWRWAGDSASRVGDWVARQGTVRGLDLVDFNFPQHLVPSSKASSSESIQEGGDGRLSVDEAKGALRAAGLAAGAVCLRYSKDMQLGAMTNPDPAVRRRAIDLTIEAGRAAEALGAEELVVWSAYCGYDYSLQVDYHVLWRRVVEAFQEVCDACPRLRVSLEFKPTDENTRFFAVPSTGAALLLVQDIARPNMGLTIDVGHCLAAGENPAQSVAMVGGAGKLFGVQCNDGYQRIGAEDGLMFGSVHPLMALELCVWLVKTNFKGHIYFDTFPRNEDPVREAEHNIRAAKRLWAQATRLLRDPKGRLSDVWKRHDAIGALELAEESSALSRQPHVLWQRQ